MLKATRTVGLWTPPHAFKLAREGMNAFLGNGAFAHARSREIIIAPPFLIAAYPGVADGGNVLGAQIRQQIAIRTGAEVIAFLALYEPQSFFVAIPELTNMSCERWVVGC